MKIGIVGDIHFCEYSSILRSRGNKFSTRLENCISSIEWAEEITKRCDKVIYLGDFFDKSSLNASELTALSTIIFNDVPHSFLVGNHEMGINNLLLSSSHIFNLNESGYTIDEYYKSDYIDFEICYLPYILEEDRKDSIKDYFGEKNKKRIIFSHNDIAGIQLGQFVSKAGFNIEDIEANCDLFINGHIHNGSKVTDKIINVGNLTGQNFSEDGFKYDHTVLILDTDTLICEVYENPYAINFYKIENKEDLNKVKNAIVTIKTTEDEVSEIKKIIEENNNIIASRLIIDYKKLNKKEDFTKLSVDHLSEFRKFVLDSLGTSDLLLEELEIING